MNFFDPLLTSDGKPYATERYKQIVHERYLISKNINTGYDDTLNITPSERAYLLQFIVEDLERQQQMIEAEKQKNRR